MKRDSDPALENTAASDPSFDRTAAPSAETAAESTPGTPSSPRIRPPQPDLGVGLDVGAKLGRYVVAKKLGAGGMGVVLAAYDPELDRKVAIKLVRPDRSDADPEALRTRMVREAQAMARLAHPNVISVFDVGTYGDSMFVAMELVEGVTLTTWLDVAKRSRRDVLRVFDQAGRGLAAAHAAGLVHRDFKPDNVMIGNDGRARVMDFGLARQTDTASAPAPKRAPTGPIVKTASALDLELTRAGAILGTPVYMAPEQWAGQPADARTDQYAFCVALWEAMYGQRPFSAHTLEELEAKVTGESPVAPPQIKLPRRLGAALRRGLAKDPAARFPTMDELLGELAREPITRRRLAVAAGGTVALGGVIAALALRGGTTVVVDDGKAARDAACSDPKIQLANVWDEPRRVKVRAAVAALKSPIGDQTLALVEQQLDAHAADYLKVFAPTCRGEYRVAENLRTAQTACLARVRQELAFYTDALAELDARQLGHAVQAVWTLSSASSCADPARLTAEHPQPADPKLAQAVQEARGLLDKAVALRIAGKGKPAMAAAEEALARAQKLDFPPLLGEAQWHVGQIAVAMGDAKRGQPLLEDAFTTLLASGDDRAAANVADQLVVLIGVQQQKADAAKPWLDRGAAMIKRAGSPADLEREWISAAGMVRYSVGDFDGAAPLFQKEVELSDKAYAPDDPRRGDALTNLGGLLLEKGDLAGALEVNRKTLELAKKALGPEHPDVATALMNIGLILGQKGELAEAEQRTREALAMREKILGPEHPDIVIALFNLGEVLFLAKKYEEAKDVGERALALSRKLHGDDHPDTADALENLSGAVAKLGDKKRARTLEQQVLAIRTKILEPGHPDIQRAKDELKHLR